MPEGIYAVAAGAIAQSRALEVTANNLANVNTPGFKAQVPAFRDILVEEDRTLHRVELDALATDLRSGALQETGRPLDIALRGSGFLLLEGANGRWLGRPGTLSIGPDGFLVSHDGHRVQGQFGSISVLGAREVAINQNGEVSADGVRLDRLRVVDVVDPAMLVREGDGLFAAVEDAELVEIQPDIVSGHIERANVNAVETMTELIWITRSFEAMTSVMETFRSIDGKTANELGR